MNALTSCEVRNGRTVLDRDWRGERGALSWLIVGHAIVGEARSRLEF
jgi:hypothetical protein